MKKFNYKFESILKVKESEERQLQEEYVILKKAHQNAVDILKTLEKTRENQLDEMQNNEGLGLVDINNALLYRDYLTHLKREIAVSQEEECRCREDMDAGFDRMIEKTKERKIFEKLKERHKASFVFEQLRNMQNELDDLAQGRFNHQKKSLNLEAD